MACGQPVGIKSTRDPLVFPALPTLEAEESKGIQLPSIDPNFDVFGVENILDIGEGEPLFGNFEYEVPGSVVAARTDRVL